MPGFAAERTLYKSTHLYHASCAGSEGLTTNAVLPSQSLNCDEVCGIATGVCYAGCAVAGFFAPWTIPGCLELCGVGATGCAAGCGLSDLGPVDPVDPYPTGCPSGEFCFGSIVCNHGNCTCVGKPGCLKKGLRQPQ
jgi:hypothetical protein